jgi:hypothetical protein
MPSLRDKTCRATCPGHRQRYFGRDDLSHGSFGQNLTVADLADDQGCIADRYRIGEAEVEVSSYAALSPTPTSSWTCED